MSEETSSFVLLEVAVRQFVASPPCCTAHHTNSGYQTKKKISPLCKVQNDRKRDLSLNFELLHTELEIIKECDRPGSEDLCLRSKGFPSLFNEK
jgi:hypothetical protein